MNFEAIVALRVGDQTLEVKYEHIDANARLPTDSSGVHEAPP